MNSVYIKSQTFKQFSWAFLVLIVLSSPLLFFEKSNLSLWMNNLHTPFLDFFFKYITYLGDGWLLLPLAIFLLSRSYFLSLIFGISLLTESLLVQLVLKHGFFSEVVRPIKYIANSDLLYRVPGVDIHTLHSFPSGHTQTAFLIFTMLALVCKRTSSAYLLLLIAVLVALSRVYLLQHFFVDVWVGSLIGYLFPVLISWILYRTTKLPTGPNWDSGFLKK